MKEFDFNRAGPRLVHAPFLSAAITANESLLMLQIFVCAVAVTAVALAAAVSERTGAEVEIRRLNAELKQRVSDRTAELEAANEALEAFSFSISHDLRAPLRSIDSFSRILLDKHAASLPAEGQEFLHWVRENTEQMARLIEDRLAFARLGREPVKKQSVEAARIVRQCLEELRGESEGRVVEITVGELPTCHADPSLLKQVWLNLLSNALKYTRKKAVARI